MNVSEFSSFLRNLANQFTGFPSFNKLSADSQTSAYAFTINEPEAEITITSSIDASSFKSFHTSNPEWFSGSIIVGVTTNQDMTDKKKSLDFRYISTPETTYAILYAYDFKYPDECPIIGMRKVKEILENYTDNPVDYKLNREATADSFVNSIKTAINSYRYVIFYEGSHGTNQKISLVGGLNRATLFDALKDAKCRILGIFESCHSESMIDMKSFNGQANYVKSTYGTGDTYMEPTAAQLWGATSVPSYFTSSIRDSNDNLSSKALNSEENESIIDYLIRRMEEKYAAEEQQRQLMGDAATVQSSDKPLMMLWSSTGAEHVGYYFPKVTKVFCEAMYYGYTNRSQWRMVPSNDDGLWKLIQDKGKRYMNSSIEEDRCAPCMRTFEPSISDSPESQLCFLIGYS